MSEPKDAARDAITVGCTVRRKHHSGLATVTLIDEPMAEIRDCDQYGQRHAVYLSELTRVTVLRDAIGGA
jgi:hypothetical protein